MEAIREDIPKKRIRPVGIFIEGAGLWFKNFWSFSAVYLLVYLPLAAVNIIGVVTMIPPLSPKAKVIFGAINLIIILGGIWAGIALILGALKSSQGSSIGGVLRNLKEAGRYFLAYLATALFFGGVLLVFIFAGLIAVFLLGGFSYGANKALGVAVILAIAAITLSFFVYFALRLSLCYAICIAQKTGPVTSLKRSYALTKSHLVPVFVEFFLISLVSFVCFLPLPIMGLWVKDFTKLNILSQAYQYGIDLFLIPLWVCIYVVLYSKLKEAEA